MTPARKRALKAFIIRWELHFHIGVLTSYAAAFVLTLALLPDLSNTTIGLLLLFGSILTALTGIAATIKSDDTTN